MGKRDGLGCDKREQRLLRVQVGQFQPRYLFCPLRARRTSKTDGGSQSDGPCSLNNNCESRQDARHLLLGLLVSLSFFVVAPLVPQLRLVRASDNRSKARAARKGYRPASLTLLNRAQLATIVALGCSTERDGRT